LLKSGVTLKCRLLSIHFTFGGFETGRKTSAMAIQRTENWSTRTCVSTSSPDLTCLDQPFGFGSEPRFSPGMPQFGNICSTEYVTKAGLCRRLSRRVNMIASRNPVKAPSTASVIERLLKVRRPWPVSMNPVYAIARVQKIARPCMAFTPRSFPILSPNARTAGRCLKGRENPSPEKTIAAERNR
jgi:hypothetical protein